jgi:hypothetical protein
VGVVSPGKGRLRRAAATALIIAVPLALVSAATARSGMLRVRAAKGSLPIASARLARGTKAKTKTRTIKRAGKAAFRYAFAKKRGKAEKVRIVVTFRKGKATRRKTIVCAVKIGSPKATLNMAFDGDGIGTITPAPGGTACTNDKAPCIADYKIGAKVTLKADPDATSTFEGWGGACSGTATTCTVKLRGVANVTAKFVRKTFTVTIQKAGDGDGTVSSDGPLACGDTCTATLPAGTIVRLNAKPDGNSHLVGWTGECTSTVSQCNFPVDGDITVTVTFAKSGARLAVSPAGDAGGGTITSDVPGIDCGSDCAFTFPAGTVVTLTANSAPGYTFIGWGIACSASTSATCTLTMDAAKGVSATFWQNIPLTVAVQGTGSVDSAPAGITGCTSTCSGQFTPGLYYIVLTASPSANFDHWVGCGDNVNANVCQIPANHGASPPTVTAVFKS